MISTLDTGYAEPMSRREQRRLERREMILAVARQLFLEKGYAGTTMSAISDALGGSRGTLWNHFATKEELFSALLNQLTEEFRQDLLTVLDPKAELRPAIETFCLRFLQKVLRPNTLAMHRLVLWESGRFPEVGRIFFERGPRVIEPQLKAFFADHIAAGHLKAGDPAEMTTIILSLSTGTIQLYILLGMETIDEEKIAAHARSVTATFLALFENKAGSE